MEILVHIGELREYRETYSKYVVDRAIRGFAAEFVYACTDFDDGILPRGRFLRPPNVQCPACSSGEGYMEEGDFTRAQLGPSFEFNPRLSEKLRKMTVFDMDDMKPMPVVFSIGYRYLPSATGPSTNRLEPLVMFHIPMPGRILVTDRNRGDLDWSNSKFTSRYRNRITAERRVTIHNYHPGPYASAESLKGPGDASARSGDPGRSTVRDRCHAALARENSFKRFEKGEVKSI